MIHSMRITIAPYTTKRTKIRVPTPCDQRKRVSAPSRGTDPTMHDTLLRLPRHGTLRPHIFAPYFFFSGLKAASQRIGFRYCSFARTSALRHCCCASGDSRSHACAIACAGLSAARGVLAAGVVMCTRCGLGRGGCVGDGGSDDGICVRARRPRQYGSLRWEAGQDAGGREGRLSAGVQWS